MRVGICTSPTALASPIDGLDYIEGGVGELLCPRDSEAVFAERLAAAGGAVAPVRAANSFLPGELKTTGPDVDPAAVDAFVHTAFGRAQRMGVTVIVFGSGGSRAVPDGWDVARARDQLVEHMRRWGPPAGEAGVTIALEPLNTRECNIVTSVDEGAELVRRADHPNIRLLIDTYHMAVDGDPHEAIRRAEGLIVHAHCAEGDGRGPLGTVGEDHRPYFRALKDIAYDGGVSIEATWKDLAAELPAALAELDRQIQTA